MSVHPLISSAADPVRQAKVHLASALRLAVLHQLEEGIDNHFTVTVPGAGERYLILPFGLHWSEARASDMIVFDDTLAYETNPTTADPQHAQIAETRLVLTDSRVKECARLFRELWEVSRAMDDTQEPPLRYRNA